MSASRTILAALATVALVAAPLSAQNYAAQDHGVYVFAKSGGINDLTNLNDQGTLDLKATGYTVGGGVGWQVQKYIVLRSDFTFAQSGLQRNSVDTGQDVDRFFYDAAMQLQYPASNGLVPFVFAGGGGATLHEVGTSGQDATVGAFNYGLGLDYSIPNTGWQLYVEGKSWVYNPTDMGGAMAGLDKWQNDLAWSLGVGYRFGY